MTRALIIEDQIADLQRAISVLRKVGITDIDAVSRVDAGLLRLEDGLEGRSPIPDLIILDLHFNVESGFEILRFWRSNRVLYSKTRVVVWTQMTDPELELARYFGAEVVPKWAGPEDLESALKRYGAAKPA